MKKEKIIKVIKLDNEKIQVVEIENKLENLQKEVEGYIECVDIFDHITLICNEEGKILELPISLLLANENKIVEAIAGNVLICGDNEEGDFVSLTDDQIEWFMNNELMIVFRILKLGEKIGG